MEKSPFCRFGDLLDNFSFTGNIPCAIHEQQEIPNEPDKPTGAEEQQENAIEPDDHAEEQQENTTEPDEPTSTEKQQENATEPQPTDMDLE